MMSFIEKFYRISQKNSSYLCVGLDPHQNMLPEHIHKQENPITTFNKKIIESTSDLVAAYKLNYAFYLSAGKKGVEALEETLDYIPKEVPVILDVKAGDIANTMTHYAKGFFSYTRVESITVNPLMGEDVITPLTVFKDKFFFVLALTSNPSAEDFLKKDSLYQKIAEKINIWGSQQFGAVVGATNNEELMVVRKLMPETLFLIPGIGAQGGSLTDVMKNATGRDHPLILINSSRGIIHKSRGEEYHTAAREAADTLRKEINSYL